jgi:peptide/nickel transport system substrate-binding protein
LEEGKDMETYLRRLIILVLCISLILGVVSFAFGVEKLPVGQYNAEEWEKLTGQKITRFSESPILAELVKQGKLPPVDKRLPDDLLVVEPYEEIGQYGGTWHTVEVGNLPLIILQYEPLLRWDDPGARGEKGKVKIVPNLAKKWEVSRDSKIFTIYLRKGVKWSDGQPFTADDIIFWFEDRLLNKDLTPILPPWITAGGEVKVKRIDDYTIQFSFSSPNTLFIEALASVTSMGIVRSPKHYLKQFHPKYVSMDKLNSMAKESGFPTWYQLFLNRADLMANPELPVLSAWRLTTKPGSQREIAERNPYYWKIDPAGNQLPYIDRVVLERVNNPATTLMKALSGEIDWQYYMVGGLSDYPVLVENREKGGYDVARNVPIDGLAAVALFINQNVKDPKLRELFRNRNFRLALSLAINRDEINQLLYLGRSKNINLALMESSFYYSPKQLEYATKYVRYDPKKANALLDQTGLKKRDKDGYRLFPDGSPLIIVVEHHFSPNTYQGDTPELIAKYLNAIGLKVIIKPATWNLLYERIQTSEHQILCSNIMGGFNPIWDPQLFLVYPSHSCKWAPLWFQWFDSGGKKGEEPPPEVKKLMDIHKAALRATNVETKTKLITEALRIHNENLWIIGVTTYPGDNLVIKKNLRNTPRVFSTRTNDYWLGPLYFEQFFIKQ